MKNTIFVEVASGYTELTGLPHDRKWEWEVIEYADESVGIFHNIIQLDFINDTEDVPVSIVEALRTNYNVICWYKEIE